MFEAKNILFDENMVLNQPFINYYFKHHFS